MMTNLHGLVTISELIAGLLILALWTVSNHVSECTQNAPFRGKQEGWLSPTERASVSAISLRHIIWLPHESQAGMSLPTADLQLQPAGIWLRQESLRHIFASPGHAPGTIAVNVTWMERRFNACQTHRIMYSSIFNPFPVILSVS